MLKNSERQYGILARFFHWAVALVLVGLFALGWYMTGLTYYDPWYHDSIELHKSLGVLAAVLIVCRIGWAVYDRKPGYPASLSGWEQRAAALAHGLLYLLMIALPVSGYLISTAQGHGIDLFGLFEIPALLPAADGREEIAGRVHYFLAFGGGWIVLLHVAAALKHNLIDNIDILGRMVGRVNE
ncbi:MAG: cytochrome b [Sedimenticola sp.]